MDQDPTAEQLTGALIAYKALFEHLSRHYLELGLQVNQAVLLQVIKEIRSVDVTAHNVKCISKDFRKGYNDSIGEIERRALNPNPPKR